jgi:hypothetical protein
MSTLARAGAASAASATTRLTGWSGDSRYFAFREADEIRPDDLVDVLRGRLAGVIFRGVVSPETCGQLTARFWDSPARKRRGVEAPGFYLGTYHYHKPTRQYLDESEEVAAALASVLDVPNEPVGLVRAALSSALGREDMTLRLAQHEGRQACQALLRSWHGAGTFALAPHEDRSQCTEPKQADFEIQRAADHQVMALNVCIENGGGGRLAMWNIQPDEECRRRLGVHYTGSPYPIETLEGIEMMWVDIRPGDVYLFNGGLVHAVEPNSNPAERRTTLACLFSFIDEHTVVSWT